MTLASRFGKAGTGGKRSHRESASATSAKDINRTAPALKAFFLPPSGADPFAGCLPNVRPMCNGAEQLLHAKLRRGNKWGRGKNANAATLGNAKRKIARGSHPKPAGDYTSGVGYQPG